MRTAVDKLGALHTWNLLIKPGRPIALGHVLDNERQVPLVGLPGNPVSAMVSFELFMRPALLKMMGYKQIWRPTYKAKAVTPLLRRKDGKVHFARVSLKKKDDLYEASLLDGQGSHQLAAMANAQGLAILPDGGGVEKGDLVDVIQLSEPETN